ncbi:MAG TPA: thiol-activated cytolysin family protein [Flavisolibacter sp.]|nr:thiol-activated cytolysin family protein [Flavisolibacter sp.]
MKHQIAKTFLAACFLTAASISFAQVRPTFTKLKAVNLNWYTSAKQNFYSLQKEGTGTSVVARKNLANGYQELVSGLGQEGLLEKEKTSRSTSLQNGKIICRTVTKEMDLSIRPDFNILKFSSQGQIFPGVISTASAIMNESVTTPANLPARKPMTVNINLPGAAVSSMTLTNPGTVQLDLLNNLVRQNTNVPIPAMIGLSLTEVDSRFDFAANLETSNGLFLPLEEFGIPAEVNAGTAFSGNVEGQNKRKTYLLKFIQPMFILSHNENNSGTIFQDAAAAASRSDLVMINSVTYGRMVFIRIVSEENAGTVKSAVKAKLGIELTQLNIKAGNSIEGSASVSFNSVVKEFKAVVIGGNTTAASRVISDPNQLANYINDPTAAKLSASSGAVPISFTMVRVSDYNSLGIRSVGSFEALEDCKAVQGYSIYIKNFSPSKVVDNPLAGNNEDLYGTITVKAYYRKANGTEVEIPDEQSRGANVWSESSSTPLQLKEGESKKLYETDGPVKDGKRRFVFTPEQEQTGYIIISYRIKDKIMNDGEQLGNSNAFTRYEEKDYKYMLADWVNLRDEKGCTAELKEVGGDAKICINFSMYRD